MSHFIRIPLALELVLLALEKVSPNVTAGILPLGGSDFLQVAILLLFGVAAQELFTKRTNDK
jgi:hypothetical protein